MAENTVLNKVLEKIEIDLELIKNNLFNIRLDMVNKTDFEKYTVNLSKLEMAVAKKVDESKLNSLQLEFTKMETQFKIVWAACGVIATMAATALIAVL